MFKRILVIILCSLSLILNTGTVFATDTFESDAPYVYVYSPELKEVIYQKAADQQAYPASITKIMTAILAIENLKDLDKEVQALLDDFVGLGKSHAMVCGLAVGEKLSIRDLLYGLIFISGADASNCLCRLVAGNEKKFVEKMNAKANELGLKHTHFTNATGLHNKEHYSTAEDLGKLLEYCLSNDTFREIYTGTTYKSSNGKHTWTSFVTKYSNKDGYDVSRFLGTKTGSTDEAKSTISALVKCKKQELIVIVLFDNSRKKYVQHINEILDYYENYKMKWATFYGKKIGTIHLDQFFGTYKLRTYNIEKVFASKKAKINYKIIKKEIDHIDKEDYIADIEIYDGKTLLRTIPYKAPYSLLVQYLIEIGLLVLKVLIILIIFLFVLRFILKKIRRARRKRRKNKKRRTK